MSLIDPLFAQWLQSEAEHVLRTDATAKERWGDTAIATDRLTAIASRISADTEAARQLAFFSRGPFAKDVHQLIGTDWIGYLGRVITLSIDDLGYTGGLEVFVLEVEQDRSTNISTVTVLCPLRGLE